MHKFYHYINAMQQRNTKQAIKVVWLNEDETPNVEFTNDLYNMSGSLTVNYQNGARRSCTITLSNDNGKFPVDCNNIWLGQKFQLWSGIYLDDGTPFYLSQGIFYIKNPKEVYDPKNRTLTLQGVDKWAYLDGSLFGYLRGTYVSQINQDIRDLTQGLINKSKYTNDFSITNNTSHRIDPKNAIFRGFEKDSSTADVQAYEKQTGNPVFYDSESKNYFVITNTMTDGKENSEYKVCEQIPITNPDNASEIMYYDYKIKLDDKNLPEILDTTPTNYTYVTTKQSIFLNPYTVTTEAGKTLADIILEYATILFADVYYDELGYLCFEARDRSLQNQSISNKEIIWNFSVQEKEMLKLELTNSFDTVYNDIIVLGQIIGGKQMKARIQNQDPLSETNIERIGIKTKPPYESDQYYSNQLCLDLASYYAQLDMALDRSGTLKTIPIHHIDVNKLITVSTPNNNMSSEKFLVTGYTLPLNLIGEMSLNISNIRYFSNWTDVSSSLE